MLRRLRQLLGFKASSGQSARLLFLDLDRSVIASFLSTEHGFPHPDWGAIQVWIESQTRDAANQTSLRRAVAAAWLDEVRDAMPEDHQRWRHTQVEGVAPMADNQAIRISKAADSALRVIRRSMANIRGDEPIEPVGVVALEGKESYISFTSHYYPDEGEWGTSGGVYINEGTDAFPFIAMPTVAKHALEQTLAHELTHHALRACNLPLWAEEGLTQMMEEMCTGHANFRLDREMLERQRERWGNSESHRFLDGSAFHSAEEDEQELAYHLSQLLVRGWLAKDAARFFAFARACRRCPVEDAAAEHLDASPAELVDRALTTRS